MRTWGGMQCAYHVFAPGTDFTDILKGKGLEHDLCGVEHWAYVLKGSVEVIYLDGTIEVCTRRGMLLLAGSAQLQVEGRGRDPPVQHRWRVGCARQENPGVCRETERAARRALINQTSGRGDSARPEQNQQQNEREKQNETENRSYSQIPLQPTPAAPPSTAWAPLSAPARPSGPTSTRRHRPARRPRGLQEDRSQEAGGRTRSGHVRRQQRPLLDDGRARSRSPETRSELPWCRYALGRRHDRGRDDRPVRRTPTCRA